MIDDSLLNSIPGATQGKLRSVANAGLKKVVTNKLVIWPTRELNNMRTKLPRD